MSRRQGRGAAIAVPRGHGGSLTPSNACYSSWKLQERASGCHGIKLESRILPASRSQKQQP